MELELYPLLQTTSRRALTRRYNRPSRLHRASEPYFYRPRISLLERLSRKTGMSISACAEQLLKEREFLLSQEPKQND